MYFLKLLQKSRIGEGFGSEGALGVRGGGGMAEVLHLCFKISIGYSLLLL